MNEEIEFLKRIIGVLKGKVGIISKLRKCDDQKLKIEKRSNEN